MGLLSPEETRLALQTQDTANAVNVANLPQGRAPVFGMARAGSMLGRGVGGAFGYQDPMVKKAEDYKRAMEGTEKIAEQRGVSFDTDPIAYMDIARRAMSFVGLHDQAEELQAKMMEAQKVAAQQKNADATMLNAQTASGKVRSEELARELQKKVYDQTSMDFMSQQDKRRSGGDVPLGGQIDVTGGQPEGDADFHEMLAANYAAAGLREFAKEARDTAKDIRGKTKDRYMGVGKLVFDAQSGQWIEPPQGFGDDDEGSRGKQARLIEKAMVEDGFDPAKARQIGLNVASGRWDAIKDPETGEVEIFDYAQNKVVAKASGGRAAPGKTATPTDIDPTAATGGLDLLRNVGNVIADFVGAPIPYPKTQQAKDSLQSLRLRTLSVMQEAGSWRPSVFTSKLLDQVTQQPLQFFKGDAIARSRMADTREMIDAEIRSIDNLLRAPLRPSDRSQVRQKRESLAALKREYDVIVDAFDKKASGPKAGLVEDGFRFKGGNPGDKLNWERVE